MSSFTARKIYSFRYATQVVERFFDDRVRGITILKKIYPNVNLDHAVELFRFNQKRWNIFKKLVKLCDRLADSPNPYDFEFIRARCLTSARYFNDWEEGKTWVQRKKSGLGS